jgi:hypothetical protein
MAYDAWGGSWGSSWALTWTGEHTSAPPPVVTTTTPGGVRRARFLRRAPKLPWDIEEDAPQVRVIDPPKRKRIKLPKEVIETVADAIPVEAYVEVKMPRIILPDIPVDFDDDDDDLLMMI